MNDVALSDFVMNLEWCSAQEAIERLVMVFGKDMVLKAVMACPDHETNLDLIEELLRPKAISGQ